MMVCLLWLHDRPHICHLFAFLGAVFVRNPINRELVATFEIIVSVHDNASQVIDRSVSVPNGKLIFSN